MPSFDHEGLVALFRYRPTLAPELLQSALGVAVPAFTEARIEDANLTQLLPTELRADLIVLLVDGQPMFGIILEVQLRPDEAKRYTWPLYAAAHRARARVPTCLLVVSPLQEVAEWAAQPIETGQPDSPFVPLVLGPAAVPVLAGIENASVAPELAVLSAMAHGHEPRGHELALAAIGAARSLDDERARIYYDLVMRALPEAARQALENVMANGRYEYQSDFARKYYGQGEAAGEAKALLLQLGRRFGEVPEGTRKRVMEAPVDLLERWLAAVLDAEDLEGVFADRH